MTYFTKPPHVRVNIGWKYVDHEQINHFFWVWSDGALLHGLCARLVEPAFAVDNPGAEKCTLCAKILPFWSKPHG